MAAVVLIGLMSLTAGISAQLQSTPHTCDCSGKLANIPVCGTDGFTYINICILKEAQKTDPSLGRRCVGACPCNNTVADYCHHRAASPSYTAADFSGNKSPEQMVNMVGIEHAAFGEEHLQKCFFSHMQGGGGSGGGFGGPGGLFGGRFGRRTTTKSPMPAKGGHSGQGGKSNNSGGSSEEKPTGQNDDGSDKPKPVQPFANKPQNHPGNLGGMFGGPDGPASGEAGGRPESGRGQEEANAEGSEQDSGKGQADAAKSGEMGPGQSKSPSGTVNSESSAPSSPATSGERPHNGMGPFGGHHPGGQHPGGQHPGGWHHNFPGRHNKPGRGMKSGNRPALPSSTGAVCLTNGQTVINMKQANCAVESSTDKSLGVRCLGRCEECAANPGCPTA